MGWKVLVCKLLARNPGARRLLVMPRHGWEDDMKMDCKEIRWKDVDWICLV
jgi:hypothetical protein